MIMPRGSDQLPVSTKFSKFAPSPRVSDERTVSMPSLAFSEMKSRLLSMM